MLKHLLAGWSGWRFDWSHSDTFLHFLFISLIMNIAYFAGKVNFVTNIISILTFIRSNKPARIL